MRKLSNIILPILIIFSIGLIGGCGTQFISESPTHSNLKQEIDTPLIELDLESYKDYLEIYDIKIEDYTDRAIVTGYIKNNGDKEIEIIEFNIYYLDKNGNSIGEGWGLAINKDGNNNYIPIRPNYDCQFISIIPERIVKSKSWDHKVSIEITKIKTT